MDQLVVHNFSVTLAEHGLAPLQRAEHIEELQMNLGYLCNQACNHCHVEAGPKRTELMTRDTMDKIIVWAKDHGIKRADLTGGAPEMNPDFRYLVDQLLALDISITSRCNLTILSEPGYEDLAQWYADRNIRLVCSLPCYSKANVEEQRGKGVFGRSISGLQALNALGYGRDEQHQIDLVYNPIGTNLPPPQASLEADYKTKLADDFDIQFNSLLTITNIPVKRFAHYLERLGELDNYIQRLVDNFNPETVAPLMCRHLISIDWQGYVYDCDFNQMMDMPCAATGRRQLWDVKGGELDQKPIAVAKHCYGCTAGAGSSCGGALT